MGCSLQSNTTCMTDNFLSQKPQRQKIIWMCLPIIHNIDPTIQLSWSPLFLRRAMADMLHWYSASPVHFFAPLYTHSERAPRLFYWQNFSSHNTVFPHSFYYIRNTCRPRDSSHKFQQPIVQSQTHRSPAAIRNIKLDWPWWPTA